MPYAKRTDELAKKRRWFNSQLEEKTFREREKERKARWYQLNKERLIQKVIDQRSVKPA